MAKATLECGGYGAAEAAPFQGDEFYGGRKADLEPRPFKAMSFSAASKAVLKPEVMEGSGGDLCTGSGSILQRKWYTDCACGERK